MNLYSVGHGTLESERFIALLRDGGVRRIVDVRSIPKSRHNPQFVRETLEAALRDAEIEYSWEPRLGGRCPKPREGSPDVALRHPSFRNYATHMRSVEFHAARDELLVAAAQETTAMMCSESLWWRCHRRMIADHVVLVCALSVLHLMHDGRIVPHAITIGARRNDGDLVYDIVGGQPPLSF